MHILEGNTAELTEIKRDQISGASRAEARVACKKIKTSKDCLAWRKLPSGVGLDP